MSLTVEYWPIERPAPNPRNARTHSDEQIDQIAASIREFGWTNPILVDPADNDVIAGHGRLAAAHRLELTEIPVIPLTGLSDAQKRALRLADNQLALNAGWDQALLRVELEDLGNLGVDISVIGFTADELLGFAPRPPRDQEPPDEFNEYGDNLVTHYQCPSCGYEWSGKPRG